MNCTVLHRNIHNCLLKLKLVHNLGINPRLLIYNTLLFQQIKSYRKITLIKLKLCITLTCLHNTSQQALSLQSTIYW